MENRTKLKVLPTERLVSFEKLSLWEIYEIHKGESKEELLDVILVCSFNFKLNRNEVEIIILNTSNTRKRHDGQWRYILGLQGKDYKKDGKFFTYYFMPNHTKDMVLFLLERYFILEIQIQAG